MYFLLPFAMNVDDSSMILMLFFFVLQDEGSYSCHRGTKKMYNQANYLSSLNEDKILNNSNKVKVCSSFQAALY